MTVYTDGTITLVQGSAAVIGGDTAWLTSIIVGGVIYVEADGGNALPIASVDSDTSITAAMKWTGDSGTYNYSLVRDTASGRQTIRNSEALAEYLQGLNDPALAALSGLTPAANKLAYYDSDSSAALATLTAFARSILDDADGAAVYATLGQIPNAQLRNDLTPDKAFRRGNILGTVSQASGVPTGAIIERGNNANGNYVRFADGTQICWQTVAISAVASTASTETWTYPASFNGTPAITTTSRITAPGTTVVEVSVANGTSMQSDIVIYRLTTASTNVNVIAVGRWF